MYYYTLNIILILFTGNFIDLDAINIDDQSIELFKFLANKDNIVNLPKVTTNKELRRCKRRWMVS